MHTDRDERNRSLSTPVFLCSQFPSSVSPSPPHPPGCCALHAHQRSPGPCRHGPQAALLRDANRLEVLWQPDGCRWGGGREEGAPCVCGSPQEEEPLALPLPSPSPPLPHFPYPVMPLPPLPPSLLLQASAQCAARSRSAPAGTTSARRTASSRCWLGCPSWPTRTRWEGGRRAAQARGETRAPLPRVPPCLGH